MIAARERTKGSEDDKGKGIANNPFSDAAKDHQKATEEEEYT